MIKIISKPIQKILIVTSRFFPHRGGLETVVYHLVKELSSRGYPVRTLTSRYPKELPARELVDGVTVRRLFFIYPELSYLKHGQWHLFAAGLFFLPFSTILLLFEIIYFRPDVINLHYLASPGLFLWLIRSVIPFHWIVSLHGGDVFGEPFLSSFKMWLFKVVAKRADRLTTCSNELARQAINLVPELIGKVVVIHNGVDMQLFRQASPYLLPRPFILALGQLVENKGFDLLIEGFAQITESFPQVDLVIAGEGPFRPRLEELVIQKKLGDQVHLLGSVDEEMVSRLLAGCLFLAMPSRKESFGIVALEGMASGKRVMASPIAGIWEFLPRGSNWQVEPNPDAWASALNDALDLDNFGVCLENLEAAARMDWPKVAEEYLQIYRQVLTK
jgi:glycogen(starch) synthase